MYPLVRELAAAGAPIRVPVAVTCRVLELARQPYYRWLEASVTDAELEEAFRANALFDAHRDDPEFGYRFLADEARDAGVAMADRTAWKICSDNGWWSSFGKKKRRGKGKKPGPPVHDDLCAVVDEKGRVRHEFTADAPNELWLTDITEHPTGEGKLYLCAVKEAVSRGQRNTSLIEDRGGCCGAEGLRAVDAGDGGRGVEADACGAGGEADCPAAGAVSGDGAGVSVAVWWDPA